MVMTSFKFRKRSEYAIAMMVLIGNGDKVSVKAMQANDLPRSYLVKIAKDLIKAKLIKAKEGRGGGYSLARDPDKITLLDIVGAVEGLVSSKDDSKTIGKVRQEVETVLTRHKLSEF